MFQDSLAEETQLVENSSFIFPLAKKEAGANGRVTGLFLTLSCSINSELLLSQSKQHHLEDFMGENGPKEAQAFVGCGWTSAQRYGGINEPGICCTSKRVTSKDLVKVKFLHYSPAMRVSRLFLLSIPLFQPTQSEQALVWLNLVQMVLMVGIGLLNSD